MSLLYTWHSKQNFEKFVSKEHICFTLSKFGIVNKTLRNLFQKSIFVLLSLSFKYMQSKFSYCMKKLCIIFFDEFDKSHDKRSNGVDVNKQQ
jgi:hypothetical protein